MNELERLTDEDLVTMARGGSVRAAESLLSRYKDMVRAKAHLYFMLGGDTEDVVQEGMIGLLSAIDGYDASRGSAFRTFADLCVNRQMINAVKAAGRRKHEPLNNAISLDKSIGEDEERETTLGATLTAGVDTDPEAQVLLREMAELLLSADSDFFKGLEREVLDGLIRGDDYRTIAKKLGRSPKSIDNAIQRIRAKLKLFFAQG